MQIVPRLIEQFIPKSYRISISINRLARKFSGTVVITGTSQTNESYITLHSKDLSIKSVTFDGKAAEFSYSDNDSLIIAHPNINIGDHIFVITYDGKINDAMHGMYPCYYDYNGTKKELLATQFESHHAREVLPCIDEPDAKATFDVTLTTEQGVTVLGNMPVKNQRIENDNLITTFETTPVMSSYLLAWVVGELQKKTAKTKNGVEVNVWATPAQPSDSLDFALDIATRSIDFFDEYFDTPYPLPKCDNVALPDFSSGAMENWGLVTYREIALLSNPVTTSISTKQYVATVIAHELSHQWFGNLVTMKWWNDLWLNESFATLVEYIAVDALEPDWNIWLDFASYESVVALKRDSLAGVQPVQTDVNHPDEISTLFDGAIVYAKGARLLQMLQHYIGEEAFQTGLKNYFKVYAYKNTEAKDLWLALSEASGKDIESFMTTWISQPGFPVLHVSKTDDQISLSQEKLVSKSSASSEGLWPIPLNSNCPSLPEILNERSITINAKCNDPIRFNIGSYAHFITHYDHEMLDQLIDEIGIGKLTTIDRLQLLNEQILLANAGIISSAEIVPIINALKNETDEAVWDIISFSIGSLKKFTENDDELEKKLRSFTGSLAAKQYERLGWNQKPKELETDTKLRSTIIGLMLYSEDPETIKKAIDLFDSSQLDTINPELRPLILSAVVRHQHDNGVIDLLLNEYKTTNSSELRQDIGSGLSATNDQATIKRLLDNIKDKSIVRTQDTFRWIVYLIRNKYAREATWRWIRDNWNWIDETFSGDKSYDEYPQYIASALSTRKQLKEYQDFFTPMRSIPALTRVIDIGVNEITDRVELIERDGAAVREVLINL